MKVNANTNADKAIQCFVACRRGGALSYKNTQVYTSNYKNFIFSFDVIPLITIMPRLKI